MKSFYIQYRKEKNRNVKKKQKKKQKLYQFRSNQFVQNIISYIKYIDSILALLESTKIHQQNRYEKITPVPKKKFQYFDNISEHPRDKVSDCLLINFHELASDGTSLSEASLSDIHSLITCTIIYLCVSNIQCILN